MCLAANGVCINHVIVCDDADPPTFDTCDPARGCKDFSTYDFDSMTSSDPTVAISPDSYFYDTYSTLTKDEASRIIDWIKSKVSAIRVPFCLKQIYSRAVGGVGKSVCPPGSKKIGSLCYLDCPLGYSQVGIECYQDCLPGWADNDIFCRFNENAYSRGNGYMTTPLDVNRCNSNNPIVGCEQFGALYYFPNANQDIMLSVVTPACQTRQTAKHWATVRQTAIALRLPLIRRHV